MLETVLHDVRYSLRSLRRSPGFSAVVILTLTLGVAASTSVFSVLNALVLRALPVDAPGQLALLTLSDPRDARQRPIYVSPFAAFQARQQTFETVTPYSGGGSFRTDVRGTQLDAGVEAATPEFFTVLGLRPFIGRLISAVDAPTLADAAPVAVISYRFWERQFGADPHALDEAIRIDSMRLTIIGVTPRGFHGLQVDGGGDIFVPLAVMRQLGGDLTRPPRARNVIGRLRPGATVAQAQAEAATLWPIVQREAMSGGLPAADQNDLRRARMTVSSLATGVSTLRTRYGTQVKVLGGFAAVLLVIGCVNLSGLLLVRGVARYQEFAVRVALGAHRRRLIQQQLVESVLLSLAGTVLAMPLAWWTCTMCGRFLSSSGQPLAMSLTPDLRVFVAAVAVALAAGLAIGTLPAWVATRARGAGIAQSVRPAIRGTGRAGRILVVVQIALSLTLLVSAGLLARTLANLRANDASFPVHRILQTRLWLNPDDHRASEDATYYPVLVRELSQLPGVESVGLSMYFPAYLNISRPPDPVARAEVLDQSSDVLARTEIASPQLFATIGITRHRGRDFTWDDTASSPPVAIVNATLARLLYPASDAIGAHVRLGKDAARRPIEIVGVVSDGAVANIRDPHGPILFRPLLQEPLLARVPVVHLRVAADPKSYGDPLIRVVGSFGRHFVRDWQLKTLDEQLDESMLQERLVAGLSTFFAALALLLACVGVYGLLAFAAVRRRREIGVRMALGATRRSVLWMMSREGALLALIGVVVGVPCALAAGRVIQSLLYGLAPGDPATLAIASAVFLAVATAAGLLPAIRASAVDPIHVLRED